MTTLSPVTAVGASDHSQTSGRWSALLCISLAQLMVALDATVINIALPSAQRALHVSTSERQWVVTAYTLAFGGLLLLGGRVADTIGRRRTFLVGLVGFALASAAGGAAPSFGALVAARATQGAFAALLTPTALSLLAVTFTEGKERAKAFAVFGAIAGTGGAIGLLLGGTLTEYLDWRWCLFVNVLFACVALLLGRRVLPRTPGRRGSRPDVAGATVVVAGLVAVVYGLSEAAATSWTSVVTVTSLAIGLVLLAAFLAIEARTSEPLLPLHIPSEPNRGGSYLAIGFAVVAMYGLFLLLGYYLQVVLRYSPAKAGLAFLPLSAATMVSSTTISRAMLLKVAPRLLIVPGLLLGAIGMATLIGLSVHASYLGSILPAEVILGIGMGAVFVPAFSTATLGVSPREAGVASAVANMSQQVGATLGVAVLNTIAASTSLAYLAGHPDQVQGALVHGYATAAGWAAAVLLVAALLVGLLVRGGLPARSPLEESPGLEPGKADLDPLPGSVAVATGTAC